MRFQPSLLVLLCAMTMPTAALADGLTLYNIQGNLQSGGTASGTISISPTGFVIEVNIAVLEGVSVYQFNGGPLHAVTSTALTEVFIEGVPGKNFNYLTLSFPQDPLIGYTGGPLCSLSFSCGNAGASNLDLTNGLYPENPNFHPFVDDFTSLTASVPSVPEPGTLGLVGTALMGVLAGIGRRLRVQS